MQKNKHNDWTLCDTKQRNETEFMVRLFKAEVHKTSIEEA